MKKLLLSFALVLSAVACSPRLSGTTASSKTTDTSTALYEKLMGKVKAYENAPDDYLFVVDGYLVAPQEVSSLKKLKPSDLTVVETLSFQTAKAIYGEEARENTVLINTRNMNAK